MDCGGKHRRTITRIDKQILKDLLWTKPTRQIAKEHGVCDNTIGDWAKEYGLSKPPRGYWRQLECKKIKSVV